SFIYIASRPEAQRDGYASLYWFYAEKIGLDRADRFEKAGRIDAQKADEMRAEITAAMDEHRKAASAAGLSIPPKPGGRNDTWTGFSDYELLEQIGAEGWYESYYR